MSSKRLGAVLSSDGSTTFRVWAPKADAVEVHVLEPRERRLRLEREPGGYHAATAGDCGAGTRYLLALGNGEERPDPASRWQPLGVHGPSAVADLRFDWTDSGWRGLPLHDYVLYELHVGTFTPQGTFDAVIPRLDALRDLGVTAIEIMPVAAFPGERNWGYDGVYPFAVQDSYGGPAGLQRLVDACHARGLAVVLDVVYNHIGPEGNYLERYAPYFTERYRTPWGKAVNFDGPDSDEVRRYFIENLLQWLGEFHFDALRLDAIHGIFDASAFPFLAQLQLAVDELSARSGRERYLISESDLNDARVIRPPAQGGWGHASQWCDDLHHAVHTLLTGERDGYYADFGGVDHLVESLRHGYTYRGRWSRHRRRSHGNSTDGIPGDRFVVFAQNHDQVGNRMRGDRLSTLVPFEACKLAAGVVLLSPFVPLLFMGEEYGETAPFAYFVSHGDADLIEAVRQGRRRDFESFAWLGEPPDPQAESTFRDAVLHWDRRESGSHATLWRYHKELLHLRRTLPALGERAPERRAVQGFDAPRAVLLHRWCEAGEALALFHFGAGDAALDVAWPAGAWRKRFDAALDLWDGAGSRLPDSIAGARSTRLEMPAYACALWVRDDSGR